MLAATQRLRRRDEFTVTLRTGRRSGRGTLVVHLSIPEPEPARAGRTVVPARAGFVVSRAVGGAVVRNKVRRRLRHLVRPRLDALPPGSTLVVRALPPAATADVSRLEAELDQAIASASRPRRRAEVAR